MPAANPPPLRVSDMIFEQPLNIFLYARRDIIFTVDYNIEGSICFIPLG